MAEVLATALVELELAPVSELTIALIAPDKQRSVDIRTDVLVAAAAHTLTR